MVKKRRSYFDINLYLFSELKIPLHVEGGDATGGCPEGEVV